MVHLQIAIDKAEFTAQIFQGAGDGLINRLLLRSVTSPFAVTSCRSAGYQDVSEHSHRRRAGVLQGRTQRIFQRCLIKVRANGLPGPLMSASISSFSFE